jgi:hypothetical protein
MDLDLSEGLIVTPNRHPSIQHMAKHFAYGHLPEDLQEVSSQFASLGQFLLDTQADSPELTEALRKLWEAKNCAVLNAGFLGNAS